MLYSNQGFLKFLLTFGVLAAAISFHCALTAHRLEDIHKQRYLITKRETKTNRPIIGKYSLSL